MKHDLIAEGSVRPRRALASSTTSDYDLRHSMPSLSDIGRRPYKEIVNYLPLFTRSQSRFFPQGRFQPMRKVLMRHGGIQNSTKPYKGSNPNKSDDIPESENCSLFMVGLPVDVTYQQILAPIKNIGRIFASHIIPPDRRNAKPAAKLVFFERKSAEAFLKLAHTGQYIVNGFKLRNVRWNRHPESPRAPSMASRVLHITGPVVAMKQSWLEGAFLQNLVYNLISVEEIPCRKPDKISQAWEFGSWRAQAAAIKKNIEKDMAGLLEVEFGPDSCDIMA